ncbi:MAG TPA: N-acetyltransferase [Actinomycetes bacterium]|nr:N-acetyltransferase [Actinomycetes bacterium]
MTSEPLADRGPTSGRPSCLIREESVRDFDAVRRVHTAAFGADEPVPDLVEALRTATAALAPMSFVAVVQDQVVGHVLLSAVRLDARPRLVNVLCLSPLGVIPGMQHQGIGSRLVEHAIQAADAVRAPLLFVEGSPHFYGARGFAKATA